MSHRLLAPRRPSPGPVPSRRALLGGALAFAAATLPLAGPGRAADALLSGRVYYRERILLPPDAMVAVRLLDVSRQDAPATVIAERQFPAEQRNPLPFVLSYDPARIMPGHSYSLEARITSGGRLMFRGTRRHPVLGSTPGMVQVRVEPVGDVAAAGAPAPQPDGPAGRWLVEDIAGAGVMDRVQTVLAIGPDGRVTGSGGCNRITGKADIKGAAVSFGPLATTRMACPPAVMAQERRFLDALGKVRGWRIDPARRKLHLLDGDGAPVLQLAAM